MKKKIIPITAIVLVLAAVAGAIFYFVNRQPSKEVMVVPVMNIYTSYWGDTQTLDGYVTAGSLQEIYMTEGGFDKIAVKEGQRVRKGDVLVEYDKLIDRQLERAAITAICGFGKICDGAAKVLTV